MGLSTKSMPFPIAVESVVPMPTLPSTISPLAGAAEVPEYVEPIAAVPSTSSLF